MTSSHGRRRTLLQAHVARTRSTRDKGFIIVLTALLLLPLMALTGFAVDIGAWYARAQKMQQAADASALAAVVWVEDYVNPTKYRDVGLETAAKNGFVHNPPEMTVNVEKVNGNQVRVTITDRGTQFFSQVVMQDPQITRRATAEYIEPVPLGSPRNFLGTGRLGYSTDTGSSYFPEALSLSINGLCTSKNQGDRRAAQRVSTENCTGTGNTEYSSLNYEYYIELPAGRTYATDVLIYDGSYITSTGCDPSSNSCRHNGDSTYSSNELAPSTWFPDDFNPGGGSMGTMTTNFRLYRADTTPLDDSDNPAMDSSASNCSTATRSFGSNAGAAGTTISPTPNGTKSFAPSSKTGMTNTGFFPSGTGAAFRNISYGWWNLCRIPASAPAGKYILKIDNGNTQRNGSNNFAVVAHRVGTTNTALCNSVTDSSCPKVYAKQYLSVRAAASGATAQFYLAEVADEHAGKTLKVELWDPAEGGYRIRLMAPTGAGTWGYVKFRWRDSSGNTASNVDWVPVSSYDFNGKLLTLEYTLPTTYTNPGGNAWWKIEYQFISGTVTDRTTWSTGVTGDPVHLTE